MCQFQGNENCWGKWAKFSLEGSFLVHVPIIQPLVHLAFFTELRSLDEKIQENQHYYKIWRKTTLLNSDNKILDRKKAIEFGKQNQEHLLAKNTLLATFLDLKLLEAFLEAAPQFAFQISVILQDGLSSSTQIFTIVTSALSLTWASSELYLNYPTEVNLKII